MKGELNPKLKPGDLIICYHMDGETSVTPGTKGIVTSIAEDPFEKNGELIQVDWENGSKLPLVTSVDAWKKVIEESITEDFDPWKIMVTNENVFQYFDWRWLEQFLYKIRKSGIINMLHAAPLLYSGKDFIDRYYGEGLEDDEDFQEVLNNAEKSKNKIIQGVVKYMEDNNKDLDDLSVVNRFARHFSDKMLLIYIALSSGEREN